MLKNLHGYSPISLAEASCIIAHLFAEIVLPCSACNQKPGVITIQGTAYDGNGVKIEIEGEEVRYYGKHSTLERIRSSQCTKPAPRKPKGNGRHCKRSKAPPA